MATASGDGYGFIRGVWLHQVTAVVSDMNMIVASRDYIYIYIHIYIYNMYIYTHCYIHIYICIYIYVYVYTYVHIYVCVYISLCIHTLIHTHTHRHIHIHPCICMYIMYICRTHASHASATVTEACARACLVQAAVAHSKSVCGTGRDVRQIRRVRVWGERNSCTTLVRPLWHSMRTHDTSVCYCRRMQRLHHSGATRETPLLLSVSMCCPEADSGVRVVCLCDTWCTRLPAMCMRVCMYERGVWCTCV